jgi:spectinomycin phosphotransferase
MLPLGYTGNMIEKQPLSPQCIIDCLKSHYGIGAVSLTTLLSGADRNAYRYKAESQGPSYFVKLRRGHHYDISVAVLAELQASGIEHIIPPVPTNLGELTHHINGFTLIVYPFIEGQDGFCYNLSDDQWVTLGQVLRRVHAFDLPPSLKDRIRKETYSPRWREAVRSLDAQAFIREHREVIRRLVDGAERLSRKVQEQSPEFVLCHSDIHGGNVMIDGNGAIYIVDWDDPILAPKERDLMFIGGGVANVWNNPHEEECFYQGYGKTDINKAALAYYRYERIVEDIAEYGQALLLTAVGDETRLEIHKQFTDMFEPRGVVDIAFQTG